MSWWPSPHTFSLHPGDPGSGARQSPVGLLPGPLSHCSPAVLLPVPSPHDWNVQSRSHAAVSTGPGLVYEVEPSHCSLRSPLAWIATSPSPHRESLHRYTASTTTQSSSLFTLPS